MSYSSEVLADSPWCYWRLGDPSGTNADDASPNNRDGTYSGSPTLAQSGALAGDADTAVSFDATNDRVQSTATFTNTAFSIEVWYEYSGTPPGTIGHICGCADGELSETYDKNLVLLTDGKLRCHVYDGAAKDVDSPSALTAGWHHLAATGDNTTLRLYVDGAEVNNLACGASYTGYSAGNVFVASTPGSAYARLAGKRDEFAIYTTALSAARVLAHYNAGVTAATVTPVRPDFRRFPRVRLRTPA